MKRKDRINRINKIKERILVTALALGFFLAAGIVGRVDCDVYAGVHTITGIVTESVVKASNGNEYKVPHFQDGSEVEIKLDGNGNVLSIVVK